MRIIRNLMVLATLPIMGIGIYMMSNKNIMTNNTPTPTKNSLSPAPIILPSQNSSATAAPSLVPVSPAPSNQTSTSSTSSIAPAVTVTKYRKIVVSDNQTDCEITYSDGSTYRWAWAIVSPQGAWVEDGQGQNGHWQASTNYYGACDDSILGQAKIN